MKNSDDDELLDLELWLAYREGDTGAFTSLYRRHAAAVLRYAWSIVHDQLSAEDVLQETFLTVWDRRRSSRIVDESFLPWILVVCRNHARNALRRAARRKTSPIENLPVATSDPPHELAWIGTEISKLSVHDRLLCQLCLVEGYSYADAARVLDTTEAAVGKRLQRVRSRLARATGATD
jgi:RNA polymerase sigma factor (sigma-70 family)